MRPAVKLLLIGAACAIPFGLAVRDEVGDRAGASTAQVLPPGSPPPEPVIVAAPLAPTPPPEPAALPADAAAQLLGPTAGTLGPLFDGVRLGAASTDFLPDAARGRIEAFKAAHGASIDFDFDERELLAVRASAPGAAAVLDAIQARWGAPAAGGPRAVWVDGHGGRMSYEGTDGVAALTWDRYQSVAELILPTDKSRLGIEPFPVVGARLDRLARLLGPRLVESESYADHHVWTARPLPSADAPTTATAVVEDGVIVELVVEAGGDHADALRAALTAKYGRPTRTDGEPWRQASWTGRRSVDATVDSDRARIAIRN